MKPIVAVAPPAPATTGTLAVDVAAAGARVVLDGVDAPTALLAAGVAVRPGPHELVVFAPGRKPQHRVVQVVAGERQSVGVELAPAARRDKPPVPPRAEPPKRPLDHDYVLDESGQPK